MMRAIKPRLFGARSSDRPSGERSLVVLITRMETINAGNQALSSALIQLTSELYPRHKVVALERRPPALEGFSLSGCQGADHDDIGRFRRFADGLLTLDRGILGAGRTATPRVEDPRLVSDKPGLAHRVLRRLQKASSRLSGWIGSREFSQRLWLYRHASLVIANPAGEFDPSGSPDTPAQLLLDLYVARRCGASTAIVNHSVEVRDDRLRRLIPDIYAEFDVVVARDDLSKDALVEFGVPAERIGVAPDLAFALDLGDRSTLQAQSGGVALALNPHLLNLDVATAETIVDMLTARSTELTFVSNCWKKDRELAKHLLSRSPLNLQDGPLDFRLYSDLLSGFEFVVSSRLHTIVLALLRGVPVIPLETQLHKISGLMESIGYPLETIRIGSENWPAKLETALDQVTTRRSELCQDIQAVVARAADLTRTAYRQFLSEALVPGPRAGQA
jgi:polysaccharide pyruvyl transferase WcaK-like protein